MNEIIEQMLKKNFIDIWTMEIFRAIVKNSTLDEIKKKLFDMAEGIICLKRNISRDSSSLCLAMVNVFWEKALTNFQSKEQDKESILKGLCDFFEEITKPTKIRVSVVADSLMMNTVKQFYLKKTKIGLTEVEIGNLLVETGGEAKLPEEMKNLLMKKEVRVFTKWDDFFIKSKNGFTVVIGGKYLFPSEKEFKERIFQLLQRGNPVFLFETILFTDEESRNLEDIVNTSPFPDNEIVFWNGGIKVKKPFSLFGEAGMTGLTIIFGSRQPD